MCVCVCVCVCVCEWECVYVSVMECEVGNMSVEERVNEREGGRGGN